MHYLEYWVIIGIIAVMFRMAMDASLVPKTIECFHNEFSKDSEEVYNITLFTFFAIVATIAFSIILWPIMLVNIIVKLLR